jgi:hypothetical protein
MQYRDRQMKPEFLNFKALLLPAFLLRMSVLTMPAEPQAVPPAFEESKPAKGTDPFAPFDPFALSDAASAVPPMVQVQVEFVELSHKALSKLLFLADPDATNGTALRKKVQAMVEKDNAEVLDTQVVVSRSGQRTKNESIHEFIYPTEYEPPSLPCNFTSGPSSTVAGENAIPTAFDTRNLGGSLEVEPAIGEDGKLVELKFIPELVWHTGNTTHLERKDTLGHVSKLEMPDIYAVRLNTAVHCVAGQYLMAAVLSPKDSKGNTDMTRKVMVFVKCDILTAK